MRYVFNEICGKIQGKMLIVDAETINEAMKKANVDDFLVHCYDRFSKHYVGGLYELYEYGKPENVLRICHIKRKE